MRKSLALTGLLTIAVLVGCSDPGGFVYGTEFDTAPFAVFDATAGIHPSEAVKEDPNNPFALAAPGPETKWDIQGSGNRVAAYYSWATWLLLQPTGEHQYYVALNLRQIWSEGQARQEDLATVREMAIAAYQSVLDNFPDAASFGCSFRETCTSGPSARFPT